MITLAEVLPCPFCGGKPVVMANSVVECRHCASGRYAGHPSADIAVWQNRAPQEIPTPRINIKCETVGDGITGTCHLNVVRVEPEDDGSFTAVTDFWPKETP